MFEENHKYTIYLISERKKIDITIRTIDQELDAPVSEKNFYESLLSKISLYGFFLVVTCNGHAVGYCAFYANDITSKKAFISLIVVAPKMQKKHIGTMILNASIEVMKKKDMESVFLEVRKENYGAIEFYKKNSFKILKENDSSFLMEKLLR